MSEFGNETVTATMRTGEKTISALLKLLKFIVERNDRKLNRLMKKQQISQAKNNIKKGELQAYLDQHRGKVNATKLLKCGETLIPLKVALSPAELKRFNRLARIEGVTYTAISNERIMEELKNARKELKDIVKQEKTGELTEEQKRIKTELQNKINVLENQRDDKIIIIREKDLKLVKDITDRMNMEIQISDIDQKLNALLAKEGNLTDQEKIQLEELEAQKKSILSGEFDAFNEENSSGIYQNAVGNPGGEKLTFDRAVCRVTDRKYADQPCYMCERTAPENYIIASSEPKEYDGRTFTNTEYRVFKDGEEQTCSEFSHGKFTHYSDKKGSNSTYYGDQHWENMKREMREKGGFSDDMIIFSSEEDYLNYKKNFEKAAAAQTVCEENEKDNTVQKENTGGISRSEMPQPVNYDEIIENIQAQIKEKGFEIDRNGQICRAETGVIVASEADVNEKDKIPYAETLNLREQISIYSQLNTLQTDRMYALQQQEAAAAVYSSQEKTSATSKMFNEGAMVYHKQIYDCNNDMAVLSSKLNRLKQERQQLASISVLENAKKIKDRKKESKEKVSGSRTNKKWEQQVSDRSRKVQDTEIKNNKTKEPVNKELG